MRKFILLSGLMLLMNACLDKPKYSDTPTISYNSGETVIFRDIEDPLSLSKSDSIIFAFNFEDGDGDLGLDEEDRKDATNINFYMDEYKKVGGVWQQSLDGILQPIQYREQFQLLSPKSVSGPIDGILFNVKQFFHANYNLNDTLKFTVKIKDRAGNFSNTIETPIFIIAKN